jgi:hypothetical protein
VEKRAFVTAWEALDAVLKCSEKVFSWHCFDNERIVDNVGNFRVLQRTGWQNTVISDATSMCKGDIRLGVKPHQISYKVSISSLLSPMNSKPGLKVNLCETYDQVGVFVGIHSAMDVLFELFVFELFGGFADFQDMELKVEVAAFSDVRVGESANWILFVDMDQSQITEVATALDDWSLVDDLL